MSGTKMKSLTKVTQDISEFVHYLRDFNKCPDCGATLANEFSCCITSPSIQGQSITAFKRCPVCLEDGLPYTQTDEFGNRHDVVPRFMAYKSSLSFHTEPHVTIEAIQETDRLLHDDLNTSVEVLEAALRPRIKDVSCSC